MLASQVKRRIVIRPRCAVTCVCLASSAKKRCRENPVSCTCLNPSSSPNIQEAYTGPARKGALGKSLTHTCLERLKKAELFTKYLFDRSIFYKKYEREMFSITDLTSLLQIFCEILLYTKVIFKSVIDADDNFRKES